MKITALNTFLDLMDTRSLMVRLTPASLPFVVILFGLQLFLSSCERHTHDIIITNGLIHDGSGGTPYRGALPSLMAASPMSASSRAGSRHPK
jgi:hypothetical protein